jgi:hypothetical protein
MGGVATFGRPVRFAGSRERAAIRPVQLFCVAVF